MQEGQRGATSVDAWRLPRGHVGAKSEVAHLWAKWLRNPCHLGDATASERGGGNQKWPTCGQTGYVTLAVSGIPTAAERGAKSEVAIAQKAGVTQQFRPLLGTTSDSAPRSEAVGIPEMAGVT